MNGAFQANAFGEAFYVRRGGAIGIPDKPLMESKPFPSPWPASGDTIWLQSLMACQFRVTGRLHVIENEDWLLLGYVGDEAPL